MLSAYISYTTPRGVVHPLSIVPASRDAPRSRCRDRQTCVSTHATVLSAALAISRVFSEPRGSLTPYRPFFSFFSPAWFIIVYCYTAYLGRRLVSLLQVVQRTNALLDSLTNGVVARTIPMGPLVRLRVQLDPVEAPLY